MRRKKIATIFEIDENLKERFRMGCDIRESGEILRIDIIEDNDWGAVCEIRKVKMPDENPGEEFGIPFQGDFEDLLRVALIKSLFLAEICEDSEEMTKANVYFGTYTSYISTGLDAIEDGLMQTPLETVLTVMKGKKIDEWNSIWKIKSGRNIEDKLKEFRKNMENNMISKIGGDLI